LSNSVPNFHPISAFGVFYLIITLISFSIYSIHLYAYIMTIDVSKHTQLYFLQFLTTLVLLGFHDVHSAIQDLFITLICIPVSTSILLFPLFVICIYFQPVLLLLFYSSAHARQCHFLWYEYRRFNWMSRRMLADFLCDTRVVLEMTTREMFYFKGNSFSAYMCRICARIA